MSTEKSVLDDSTSCFPQCTHCMCVMSPTSTAGDNDMESAMLASYSQAVDVGDNLTHAQYGPVA